ncbi:hypothetical protein T552_02872 [Pneumocystis carinii B80]|uniref:26S proteasome regulatory subunit RPN2 n=1 Tax=Pneumocystis carinii (strain B80) TaxID=1408658 RepID=A0A0W4ZDB7_PNEC8|nr:hypothetical protein T552_02872 [Pneumocystis carinii B80]KTW26390.1 hypothetical protein T552_02872 [Pneumocystis carinii B80]
MDGTQSVGGVLSLLDEKETNLQIHALGKLNELMDQFWHEIADEISKIETLYEDEKFPERQLAALVASKVYYHLGEYNESAIFALGAKEWFDLSSSSEYVETIISKFIDTYIEKNFQKYEDSKTIIDERLITIAEKMFQRYLDNKQWKQVLGIALEARKLDIIEEVINKNQDEPLKNYLLDVSINLVQNLDFRNKVLSLLLDLFLKDKQPDYFSVIKCVVHLRNSDIAAKILQNLILKNDEKSLLIAYQIAFDLNDSATQEFLQKVSQNFQLLLKESEDENKMNKDLMDTITSRIKSILEGEESVKLYMKFLSQNNHADNQILVKTKDSLDARNSIFHSSITFSVAFMNAGTTSDKFFRQNLDWLSKALNWSKFSATAALGVIHRGDLSQGFSLLSPYLPQESVSGSPYSEGGSLFALGLIHANHGKSVLHYLKTQLKNTQSEIIQHGAALGLGVAGMATGDEEIYEDLKDVLFTDSAVAGEAAGLAMGLVMLGTASPRAIDEMLQYAHETQHKKIIRGLALGIAMLMYAKEETADVLIDQLCSDLDPILRYGGIYTIAMAYCGTGNNKAIKRLLHTAVSDVNDDVKRASVISLGFILLRNSFTLPRMVELLSESYNPHVRYGAALSLGIACAGSAMQDALDILEPLSKDPSDFVRQSAHISTAMILIQHNDQSNSRVVNFRKKLEKVISDKHEDAMAKFGAALAQGILDAGGRNVTIGLQSTIGSLNMIAIAGTAIFTQFWYWFPLTHFLSLSFTPTALIGLNKDLRIPKFEFISNEKPSLFAYPPETKKETDKGPGKVATAVLSTTAKAQARAKKTEKGRISKENDEDTMEMDTNFYDILESIPENMDMEEIKETKDDNINEKNTVKKDEPLFEIMQNMSRVTPFQLKYICFKNDSRYIPVKKPTGGILMMMNKYPDEPEDFIDSVPEEISCEEQELEADPPEPFEYSGFKN